MQSSQEFQGAKLGKISQDGFFVFSENPTSKAETGDVSGDNAALSLENTTCEAEVSNVNEDGYCVSEEVTSEAETCHISGEDSLASPETISDAEEEIGEHESEKGPELGALAIEGMAVSALLPRFFHVLLCTCQQLFGVTSRGHEKLDKLL